MNRQLIRIVDQACIGFSGIDTPGCSSEFGTFAFVLGPGTADAVGFLTGAIALGLTDPANASSTGFFSLAYAGGGNTDAEANGTLALAFVQATEATARAGSNATDFGNIGINLGRGDPLSGSPDSSIVFAGNQDGLPNLFNLVVNTSNTTEGSQHPTDLEAGGLANSAFNIGGEDNQVFAIGAVNNVTNFFGAGNELSAEGGTGLTDLGLNVAASFFTNGGAADSGPGPFDISFATPFNPTSSMALNNVSVSGGEEKPGTQGGVIKQLLSFRPGGNAGSNATSLGGSGATFKSVSDGITASVKKFGEAVKNVTNKLAPSG